MTILNITPLPVLSPSWPVLYLNTNLNAKGHFNYLFIAYPLISLRVLQSRI